MCKSVRDYPELIRKVICTDPKDGTRYIFLTNNLEASPQTISLLYRNRWSVELFFKWIKQDFKIKKFWGTSGNAVRIQIYCAIITYCLVVIVQHDMQLERNIYEVLQILGISLTDKTHLRALFNKSNIKNVNDLYGFREPNLFNSRRLFVNLFRRSVSNRMMFKYLSCISTGIVPSSIAST